MCAAWLTIWSIASSEKLIVISSTTGRRLLGRRALLGVRRVDRPPAADLVAEHVDVVVERVGLGVRRGVGERDGVVDDGDDLLVHPLRVAVLQDALGLETLREGDDRV